MSVLKSSRLRLAPPHPRDWAALSVLQEPLALDRAEVALAARVFAEWADLTGDRRPEEGGGWTLTRVLTHRPVGLVLYAPDPSRPGAAGLSIAINESARGRGFATEALGAVMTLLSNTGAFTAFTATIAPRNTPCLRLFVRAGFQPEGEAALRTSRGDAQGVRFVRPARTQPREPGPRREGPPSHACGEACPG